MQINNPFREPVEWYTTVIFLLASILLLIYPHYFLLNTPLLCLTEIILLTIAGIRGFQGLQVHLFQQRLLHLKVFSYSTSEVPLYEKNLYIGLGFVWKAEHTQRKTFINAVLNNKYQHKSHWYEWARDYEMTHSNRFSQLISKNSPFNPLRPLPDLGGKPWLHGLNETEKPIGVLEVNRNGHMLVIGTTRVGKTRLVSNLVNQDIRRGEAVIVLDPKGDLEILRDMYAACAVSNRLEDFKIVHVAFPEISACLNTLASYSQIAEVATRVTSAIPETGEGGTFKKFAWKYINIVAQCLVELNEPINYERISFYVTRPEALLVKYADRIFSKRDPHYHQAIEAILEEEGEVKNKKNPTGDIKRSVAVKKYIGNYIETSSSNNDIKALVGALIVPLYEASVMDSSYYQKITASAGPALDQINQSPASTLFSFDPDDARPEVKFIDVIKRKQVVYIGLNSLENREVSSALGKAIISDLVSCAGKIYNAGEKCPVSIYCDEFSEIVQEEFITLVNKSGGAGFRVIAATQTINDLSASFGNKDKAKQLEGNFQTVVIMRVRNDETANLIINQLPEVELMSYAEGSSSSDLPNHESNIYFNTSNDTRMTLKPTPLLHVNDIISLPQGHAFVFTNGGVLSKVRIPLPKADDFVPKDFVELIERVNEAHEKH